MTAATTPEKFSDRELRQFLLDALNGRHVGADICWLILSRWDGTEPVKP